MPNLSLSALRRCAVTRSLFPPTSLERALAKLGFVQADPIRAPARAQDLTLRHRVRGYRAGDLERRYPALEIEEDVFINYGFVTRLLHALMHPRAGTPRWSSARRRSPDELVEFVRARGAVHPREVDAHFSRGRVTNYWGGSSIETTHRLEDLHYRGLLRVVRRDAGIRVYSARDSIVEPLTAAARRARVDAMVDIVVNLYAPLPAASLSNVISRLRYAVPQWRGEVRAARARAIERLSHARVDGLDWYWPTAERITAGEAPRSVRLLAPFDPVVWDRRRFEILWGWAYRFEAYTPAPKRRLGYYALPLLYGDRVIGWGNATMKGGDLKVDVGFVSGAAPRDAIFKRELDAEIQRLRDFLQPLRFPLRLGRPRGD